MKSKNKSVSRPNNKIIDSGLYKNIKYIIETARNYSYNAVNFAMVQAYWNIGRKIVEEEQKGKTKADYGDFIINELSVKLTNEYGKGFDSRNLFYMKQFYLTFPIVNALRSQSMLLLNGKVNAVRSQSKKRTKSHAMRDQSERNTNSYVLNSQSGFVINNDLRNELTWTHYRLLMRVESKKARDFYVKESIENSWSTRQLERQIQTFYFERLLASQKKQKVKKEVKKTGSTLQNDDFIKNPYILEFLNLKAKSEYLEKDFETALIDKLQEFILELGRGFAFVERQQRITTEHDNFYIDLVFYNYLLKCFVLIDLKIGKLTHQDIGQMDMYVRMYEDLKKGKDDNPTIGLILCSEKSETIVKYSVLKGSKQLFASKYMLYLPTEKELKTEIQKEINKIKSEKLLKEKV